MSPFAIDQRQVRHAFERAARSYEQHDVLQREVQELLLEHLALNTQTPTRIVDLGAGTGRGSAALKKRFPKARVVALDLAVSMLREARRHRTWRRPFACVAADVARLPFIDHSVDLLHSNLCIQWCDDLPGVFSDWVRVLKPGGFVLLSTFGPDTLRELRAAWAASDVQAHVGSFLDVHDLGDAMLAAGLRDPVLDVSRYTLTYAEPQDLLCELKGLGATNAVASRQRGLTGKAHYRRMLDAYETTRANGRIPASWEVITAHAFGPEPGQPTRTPGGGEVASFSVDALRGSRRGPAATR